MLNRPGVIGTLGYAILGLLRERPGSGYEIRNVFDSALLHRFSSSPGSIYPALKRLQKQGLVTHRGSDRRGQFAITEIGRSELVSWLTSSVTVESIEAETDVLLLKFAFMEGVVAPEDRRGFLSSFEQAVDEHLDTLLSARDSTARQMPLHGRLILDHQIAVAETNRGWAAQALLELSGP